LTEPEKQTIANQLRRKNVNDISEQTLVGFYNNSLSLMGQRVYRAFKDTGSVWGNYGGSLYMPGQPKPNCCGKLPQRIVDQYNKNVAYLASHPYDALSSVGSQVFTPKSPTAPTQGKTYGCSVDYKEKCIYGDVSDPIYWDIVEKTFGNTLSSDVKDKVAKSIGSKLWIATWIDRGDYTKTKTSFATDGTKIQTTYYSLNPNTQDIRVTKPDGTVLSTTVNVKAPAITQVGGISPTGSVPRDTSSCGTRSSISKIPTPTTPQPYVPLRYRNSTKSSSDRGLSPYERAQIANKNAIASKSTAITKTRKQCYTKKKTRK
jgi:hypothetical protein